jgi:hypothetical protein
MTPQVFSHGATMFRFFPDLGRRAMIDFGLSGLLDRIERDFGKRMAKGLTILIGVTIACACLSVIGTVLSTAWMFVLGASEDTTWLGTAYYVVGLLVQLVAVALVPSAFATVIEQRRTNGSVQRALEEGRQILDRAERHAADIERMAEEAKRELLAAQVRTEVHASR